MGPYNISGESNQPLTPILLKSIAIHLPFLSRYFCKSMPSSWQKVVYTPPICITIRLPFVSRYFCRSIGVRGRSNTPNVYVINSERLSELILDEFLLTIYTVMNFRSFLSCSLSWMAGTNHGQEATIQSDTGFGAKLSWRCVQQILWDNGHPWPPLSGNWRIFELSKTPLLATVPLTALIVSACTELRRNVTLTALQKHFVDFFFEFAWEFCIEKWRGFLVNFVWSPSPTKWSTKTPQKIQSKIQGKIRDEKSKNSGNFRSATFLT